MFCKKISVVSLGVSVIILHMNAASYRALAVITIHTVQRLSDSVLKLRLAIPFIHIVPILNRCQLKALYKKFSNFNTIVQTAPGVYHSPTRILPCHIRPQNGVRVHTNTH